MFDSQVTILDTDTFLIPGDVHFPDDTRPALKTTGEVVLAINWYADNEPWWEEWWGKAKATRALLPPELRRLDETDHTPPVTLDRLEALLEWCRALPSWETSDGPALLTLPVLLCDCDGGMRHVRDCAYTPGRVGPARVPCYDCNGKGWVVTDD